MSRRGRPSPSATAVAPQQPQAHGTRSPAPTGPATRRSLEAIDPIESPACAPGTATRRPLVVELIGPAGSGKTTLATALCRRPGFTLGIELPRNFNQPHGASNIAEFWRRWHMTFAHCMRDYIYLPLGGSRASAPRVYTNLFITLLIAGLWHGAAWGFVVWGAMHGVGLVLYKMVQDRRRARGIDPRSLVFPWWYTALAWLYTLHLIVISRFFFYTPDVETALAFGRQLLSASAVGRGMDLWVIPVIGLVFAMNFFGNAWRERFIAVQRSMPGWLRPLFWMFVLWAIASLQPSAVNPNVYFGF